MKKRFVPLALIVTFILSLCTMAASAAEIMPFSSTTISNYTASATAGSGAGKIKINYDVQATGVASSVGVAKIEIHESDGTCVDTINGNTRNGLMKSNVARHKSSYTYSGTSGVSYYAVITFEATIGSESDQRTITTNTVKAP